MIFELYYEILRVKMGNFIKALEPGWLKLAQQAHTVADNAYAPYSDFPVGCALELNDGTVVLGANQENASYPLSMCAERVALFSAKTQFPSKTIDKLFIIAPNSKSKLPIAPCGACRQVIYEMQKRQSSPIEIVCGSEETGYLHFNDAGELLPNAFGPEDLL